MKEFRQALKLSIPVLGAYWFLGATYGLLAASMGYDLWIPLMTMMLIYSGSVEFIALTMLASSFNPMAALTISLMVGARHLFYGISMIERFRNAKWKKPLLIFWMSDETFAINYSSNGTHTQQLWVSLLDYVYWMTGGIMGFVLGDNMKEQLLSKLEGLDFVVTAMFVAIFMDDYLRNGKTHGAAYLGIVASVICVILFGSSQFILPTMLSILMVLYIKYRREVKI